MNTVIFNIVLFCRTRHENNSLEACNMVYSKSDKVWYTNKRALRTTDKLWID